MRNKLGNEAERLADDGKRNDPIPSVLA